MALMQWHIVTRDQFDAGTPIDGHMYFITGENTIYRGENGTVSQYNKAIEFYTGTLPTSPAPHRLYVDTETFAGKMWDGSKWNAVIRPLTETVTADDNSLVTSAAVATYVSEQIANITGSGTVLTGAEWDPENINPDNPAYEMLNLSAFLDEICEQGHISYTAYEKICRKNALKLLDKSEE